MIFHSLKCIFVAQRKTAGTSVARALGLPYGEYPEWHWGNGGVLSREWHSRPADYHVFSVVRNPWDRFISGWLFCPQTRGIPLRDLLRHLPTDPYPYVHITRMQRDVLFDGAGSLITDHLVRFERLQEGIDVVCDHLATPRVSIPRDNACPVPRRHYREYFDSPIDQELFLRHYARDVDAFEYEF